MLSLYVVVRIATTQLFFILQRSKKIFSEVVYLYSTWVVS